MVVINFGLTRVGRNRPARAFCLPARPDLSWMAEAVDALRCSFGSLKTWRSSPPGATFNAVVVERAPAIAEPHSGDRGFAFHRLRRFLRPQLPSLMPVSRITRRH